MTVLWPILMVSHGYRPWYNREIRIVLWNRFQGLGGVLTADLSIWSHPPYHLSHHASIQVHRVIFVIVGLITYCIWTQTKYALSHFKGKKMPNDELCCNQWCVMLQQMMCYVATNDVPCCNNVYVLIDEMMPLPRCWGDPKVDSPK